MSIYKQQTHFYKALIHRLLNNISRNQQPPLVSSVFVSAYRSFFSKAKKDQSILCETSCQLFLVLAHLGIEEIGSTIATIQNTLDSPNSPDESVNYNDLINVLSKFIDQDGNVAVVYTLFTANEGIKKYYMSLSSVWMVNLESRSNSNRFATLHIPGPPERATVCTVVHGFYDIVNFDPRH